MQGLTLTRVEGLTFERSVIRGCTYGILTMEGCSRVVFRDSQFTGNREFHGFEIRECLDVKLEGCRVANNPVAGLDRGALFNVAPSSEVEMIGGLIHANRYGGLVRPAGAMTFERVDVRDNRPPQAD